MLYPWKRAKINVLARSLLACERLDVGLRRWETKLIANKLSIAGAPGAPTNIRVNDVTNTSVKLTWTAGYNWGTSQSFRIDLNTSLGWRPVVSSILSSEQQEYSRKVTDLDPNREYQIRIKACNSAKGCNKDKFDEVLAFKTKGTVHVFHMLLMSLLSAHISINYPNNYSEIIPLVMCVILTHLYFSVAGSIMNHVNWENRWMWGHFKFTSIYFSVI